VAGSGKTCHGSFVLPLTRLTESGLISPVVAEAVVAEAVVVCRGRQLGGLPFLRLEFCILPIHLAYLSCSNKALSRQWIECCKTRYGGAVARRREGETERWRGRGEWEEGGRREGGEREIGETAKK